MDNSVFNPKEHMTNLKGKDYLEVKWRLVWFRTEHPLYGINTEVLELNENHAIFKASVTDEDGRQVSCGTGSESVKDFNDFIEKAETKAVGRALAMLGYGTQFAPELEEGSRIVDAPVEKKQNVQPSKMQQPTKIRATAYKDSYNDATSFQALPKTDEECEPPFDSYSPDNFACLADVNHIKRITGPKTLARLYQKYGFDLERMRAGEAKAWIKKAESILQDQKKEAEE